MAKRQREWEELQGKNTTNWTLVKIFHMLEQFKTFSAFAEVLSFINDVKNRFLMFIRVLPSRLSTTLLDCGGQKRVFGDPGNGVKMVVRHHVGSSN